MESESRWEHVKKIGPIVVFSIILPFTDIYTDFEIIIKLFMSKNENFASLLFSESKFSSYMLIPFSFLVPFLASYLASFFTWYRLERDRRLLTLVFPLFNMYSIYGSRIRSKTFAFFARSFFIFIF